MALYVIGFVFLFPAFHFGLILMIFGLSIMTMDESGNSEHSVDTRKSTPSGRISGIYAIRGRYIAAFSGIRKIGTLIYLASLVSLILSHEFVAVILFLIAFAVSGKDPLIKIFAQIRSKLTSFNPERWVNYFSNFLITIGVVFVIAALPIGLALSIDGKNTASRLLPLCVGIAFLVLGFGIRRRALWAGALGLGLTFFAFIETLNSVLKVTGGDISNLPHALFEKSFGLLLTWIFFFGFYAIFFPMIADRTKELTRGLEEKLKDTDDELKNTQVRLQRAETDVSQVSQSLEDERTKLKALFETTNEGIIIFDTKDVISYINPAYCSLYEIERSQWEGKIWHGIFGRPNMECINHSVAVCADKPCSSLRADRGEVIFRDDRGQIKKCVAFYTKEINNQNGEIISFMGLSRDVTLEREIDRMKTEFVSNVSHELRTPLTSIRAYTEMLMDNEGRDTKTQNEYLQIILDESERLTNLINDILDLSKMEAGKKVYKFQNAAPAEIVKKVAAVCLSEANKKEQKFSVNMPSEERTAFLDPDLLHQSIMNITNNAIKYTPKGGTISLCLEYRNDNYVISVKDDGLGISKEDQKKLFSKFFRVEGSLTRDIGGTGLGLALVKQIALIHHGDVIVESEIGQGAKFSLIIPWSFTPPLAGS